MKIVDIIDIKGVWYKVLDNGDTVVLSPPLQVWINKFGLKHVKEILLEMKFTGII